jgi:hypothetical protein
VPLRCSRRWPGPREAPRQPRSWTRAAWTTLDCVCFSTRTTSPGPPSIATPALDPAVAPAPRAHTRRDTINAPDTLSAPDPLDHRDTLDVPTARDPPPALDASKRAVGRVTSITNHTCFRESWTKRDLIWSCPVEAPFPVASLPGFVSPSWRDTSAQRFCVWHLVGQLVRYFVVFTGI